MTKILIVEDQADIRQLMRMTLDDVEWEVGEAGNGAAGWNAVLENMPDIVLLDIMMPGEIDGLDLCRRIKSDERTRHVKVVMVSARGHRNDMATGLDAGADDYLIKPFSPLRLIEVIDSLGGGGRRG